MRTTPLFACALLVASATGAAAQESPLGSRRNPGSGHDAALLVAERAMLRSPSSLLSERGLNEMARARREVRGLRRTAHLLGGAFVGAGIGYLASQVVYSDWAKDHDGAFADRRLTYALTGAVFGSAGGFLVGGDRAGGFPGLRDAPSTPTGSSAARRRIILKEEMGQTSAATVLELVQSLRPEWLVLRGVQRFREGGTANINNRGVGTAVAGDATIIVYLENGRLGGLETLRQVPAATVNSIEFLDAPAAQYRFGRGHTHGAIVILTAGDIN